MKVKDLLGIILVIFGIFTIIAIWSTMSSGNVEKGTEILASSITPWWLNPLIILSGSTIGIIIIVLIIIFKDKILDAKIPI